MNRAGEAKSLYAWYVFSVIAYGLKVLENLFDVRGHVLGKFLFFRFAEGVREDCGPNNDAICRTALARDFRRIVRFSNRQDPPQAESYSLATVLPDPEKQTLLRLDPLLPTSNQGICHHAKHVLCKGT